MKQRKQSPSMLLLDQHRQEIEEMLKNGASEAFLVRTFGTSANTMRKYVKSLKGNLAFNGTLRGQI